MSGVPMSSAPTSTSNGGPTPAKRRRQRSPSPPAPRKKSCEACRKAKARCNETLPKCSRCDKKGISCDYGGTRNEDHVHVPRNPDPELARIIEEGLSSGNGFPASCIEALSSTDAFAVAGVNLSVTMPGDLPEMSHESIMAMTMDTGSPEGSSSGGSDSSSRGYQTSMTSTGESPEPARVDYSTLAAQEQKANNYDSTILPFILQSHYRHDGTKEITLVPNTSHSGEFNARFMGFNVEWPVQCSLSGNRVVGAFKVWPTLMVKGETLPPFIHPHFPGLQVSDATSIAKQSQYRSQIGQPPKLPESLANCSSICTMFYNKTPENSPFIWKSIKREQERIYSKYRDWAPRDSLFGFQAMLLYSFLRMIDGEHEYNNFDMAFVLTISELGSSLWSDKLRALQTRKADPANVNWADWMLAESVCRTSMVFQFMFIMLQLYRALPPTPGCRGIDEIPLPCGRKLWQARSYSEWYEEYKIYQDSRKSTRVLKFGDLKSMRSDAVSDLSPEEREDLAAWATDLDEFGNLTLIAGLAGPDSTLEDYRRTHIEIFA